MLTRAHLHALRAHEIDCVLGLVPALDGRLLEIGAADGFQASLLTRRFAEVSAVDLAASIPEKDVMFPVQAYDGHRLPFPNRSFDVVFSSNVLEHIADVEAFQGEIRRVLRPGGRAVHVLPSAAWRLWTLAAHYLDLPARVAVRLVGRMGGSERRLDRPKGELTKAGAWHAQLVNALIERRHGERGTTLSELYLFSRRAWRKIFRHSGFRVELVRPLGLFYTGYSLAGERLNMAERKLLARLFGSASVLYVLADAGDQGR